MLERQVFIIAAEYSGPSRKQVFVPASSGEPLPKLLELASQASGRALDWLPETARQSVRHLLVTSMPHVVEGTVDKFQLPEDALGLPAHLKRQLELDDCHERFEVGTSDAGATLFASAVRLLHGLPEESTALVVAGQVMPPGRDAINTVAQVIEREERALGLRMIPVGDALLDAFWQLLESDVADLSNLRFEGLPHGHVVDPGALAEHLLRHKIALGKEYPAAFRSLGECGVDKDAQMGRWMWKRHMALAANGACAMILTTDRKLVQECVKKHGSSRVVRVLGVGEGDQHPALCRRPYPLVFFKSIRQALAQLRRNTGTTPQTLRAAAFTIFHDAFLSIELAFLLALGFAPLEAVERAASYWTNPYGGLMTFNHAMAASGLVQIAKAFHVFTGHPFYLPHRLAETRHLDYTRSTAPIHCLTTSVGGPLTHVVATLLQSVWVDPATEDLDRLLHALDRERSKVGRLLGRVERRSPHFFEPKCTEVSDWFQQARDELHTYAEKQKRPHPTALLGVVEGRTMLDKRSLQRADGALAGLPARFAEREGELLPAALVTLESRGRKDNPGEVLRELCLLDIDEARAAAGSLVWVQREAAFLVATNTEDAPGLVPLWLVTPAHDGEGTPRALFPARKTFKVISRLRYKWSDSLEQPGEWDDDAKLWDDVYKFGRDVVMMIPQMPKKAPPPAAIALIRELVLRPDPDRWAVAGALEQLSDRDELCDEPATEIAGYCELNIVRSSQRPERQPHDFWILRESVERASGWLGASVIHISQVVDTFTVTARYPLQAHERDGGLGDAELLQQLLPQLVRFAKSVYLRCLERGVFVRGAVGVSARDYPLFQDGAYIGAAGGARTGVHRVLKEAAPFARLGGTADQSGAGHGVAIVLPGDFKPPRGLSIREHFTRVWQQAGGAFGSEPRDGQCSDGSYWQFSSRANDGPLLLELGEPFPESRQIDAFFCYHSEERIKERVNAIAGRLNECSLRAWLDNRDLRGGDKWLDRIEEVLSKAPVVVVFHDGRLGRWQNEELREIRTAYVEGKLLKVIPVRLPRFDGGFSGPMSSNVHLEWLRQFHQLKDTGDDKFIDALAEVIRSGLPDPRR